MFDRFTDRAKKVLSLSRREAQRLNHAYIGTEHLLLALVHEGSGAGATALRDLDIELERVRRDIEQSVRPGPSEVHLGQLPFTPPAKKVLELTVEEAIWLGHDFIGTEHLLIGLVRESDGIAARVLAGLGVSLEDVRTAVRGCRPRAAASRPPPAGIVAHLVVDDAGGAVEYYRKAFGAVELSRSRTDDQKKIRRAVLAIGGATFQLADDFPELHAGRSSTPKALGGTSVVLHRYVPDCDAGLRRAAAAGGQVTMPAQDMPWGERYGQVTDPFGHVWAFATPREE
jgi:uncharacterized glyoxalase superfamily protein PhnB